MKSQATAQFWELYTSLPRRVQQQARKAYQMWKENPRHPGVQFKRVDDEEPVYSARVSDAYRAVGILEGDTVIWYWIGSHDEYERLLR
ncbi:hypothetical protein DRJ17_07255 [Candidatus Woesearchaeota archaeon]|nr:MAG: hypothetical protein DRJ17_07255 [Candidatus Woesearchaeota archaeon]